MEVAPTLRSGRETAPRPTKQPTARPAPPATHPRHSNRRWIAAVAAAFSAIALVSFWWSGSASETVHYTTAPVSRGAVARSVSATGTVNPELTIIIGSYVSGVIQSVSCDYNTEVMPGQVCARIDPRPYQTAVDQAKANLGVARAQLEKDKANLAYARVTAERNRWLAERDSVSRDVADQTRSLYEQAQAQIGLDQATIEQRQAELEAAEVNFGYTAIVSPVKGTVVSRNVTQGQTVAASFQTPTLFLIATDLTRMQVDTNVSESDIGGIKEGDPATFTVDAFPRRTFEGTVTQVRQSPQTVQNVVTFDAVIGVPNTDLALKPGMTASTRIVVARKDGVIRVPNQALRYAPAGTNGHGTYVWLLRNGQPVRVVVTPGLEDETHTEIVAGDVKEGDDVIVAEQREQRASSWWRGLGF